MSAAGNASNLIQAARELNNQWQLTKTHWRDVKSQDFEQTYMEPLPGHVERAIKAMAEIEQLLKKIRGECE
jgi:hypothetical protein